MEILKLTPKSQKSKAFLKKEIFQILKFSSEQLKIPEQKTYLTKYKNKQKG